MKKKILFQNTIEFSECEKMKKERERGKERKKERERGREREEKNVLCVMLSKVSRDEGRQWTGFRSPKIGTENR